MAAFVHRIAHAELARLAAADCRALVFRHKVLVIEGAGEDLGAFQALMSRLGEPVHHVLAEFCVPGAREVLTISNLYRNGRPVGVHEGGAYWHTDMSYAARNTVFTALFAGKVPREGGATEFIDCAAGWERIRAAGRVFGPGWSAAELERAWVRHVFGNRAKQSDPTENEQVLSDAQRASLAAGVRHPLVLVHPGTGVPALYAAAATSVGVEGLDAAASRGVLDALSAELLARAPRYSHAYRPGEIVIWDNLSTLHRGPDIPATGDEGDCRLLYRINVDFSKVLPPAQAQAASAATHAGARRSPPGLSAEGPSPSPPMRGIHVGSSHS